MTWLDKSYHLLRPLLFCQDPERAHHIVLSLTKLSHLCRLTNLLAIPKLPTTVMGIHFPNPVGLAAGLDKNGEYIDALAALGFGYLEIGTVTPRPQKGNAKPRLFRLTKEQAIINRMGFNNEGVEALIDRLQKIRYKGVLGINIGKNADTPIEEAHNDYLFCLRRVYAYASYITLNISSPNTQNLRSLQQADRLEQLLNLLKAEQSHLMLRYEKYVPLVVKVAPDLHEEEIVSVAKILLDNEIDGLIVSNTTLSRENVSQYPYQQEAGGLSGAPLTQKAHAVQQQFHALLAGKIALFGSGGVMNGRDAVDKMRLGADLVQLYSGLIYKGPGLISECVTEIAHFMQLHPNGIVVGTP